LGEKGLSGEKYIRENELYWARKYERAAEQVWARNRFRQETLSWDKRRMRARNVIKIHNLGEENRHISRPKNG
jgi:hypothetical protein